MKLKNVLLWAALGTAGAAQAAPDLPRHADLDLATAQQ
ncbi:heme-binding protein, partial [Pseudomonas helleri]|nr:heme-binding protein [Pseudomonas helleri]